MAATKTASGANRTLVTLQEDWSGGMRQDKPRDQIPANSAWLLQDVFPNGNIDDGADFPLRSRNGWVRTCEVMDAGTSAQALAVGFGDFPGSNQGRILGIDEDGLLYKWTSNQGTIIPDGDGPPTQVGSAAVPQQGLINYSNQVYILSRYVEAFTYDGTTLDTLAGSPPTAAFGCVYKDHLVLADDGTNDNRVWFSDGGDPTGWNTAADGQWLDTSNSVYGLATFQNMILVFHSGLTERIRGDIIPGVINSDMVREPLFPIGTQWAKSIAEHPDGIVFGNNEGVYMTDGLRVVSLTERCGIGEYYRSKNRFTFGIDMVGGFYKDWYVFRTASGAQQGFSGAIHVKHNQYFEITNLNPAMLCKTPNTPSTYNPPRLLMAEYDFPRITDVGVMLDRSDFNFSDADGDGTVVRPDIKTRFYQDKSLTPNRWRSLYVTGGGDIPAGGTTIKFSDDPWVDPDITLSSNHTLNNIRTRINIGKQAGGMSFQITPAFEAGIQSTTGFHLDSLEAEISALYGRRR